MKSRKNTECSTFNFHPSLYDYRMVGLLLFAIITTSAVSAQNSSTEISTAPWSNFSTFLPSNESSTVTQDWTSVTDQNVSSQTTQTKPWTSQYSESSTVTQDWTSVTDQNVSSQTTQTKPWTSQSSIQPSNKSTTTPTPAPPRTTKPGRSFDSASFGGGIGLGVGIVVIVLVVVVCVKARKSNVSYEEL